MCVDNDRPRSIQTPRWVATDAGSTELPVASGETGSWRTRWGELHHSLHGNSVLFFFFVEIYMVGSAKIFYFCKSDVSAVQGHPRSLILGLVFTLRDLFLHRHIIYTEFSTLIYVKHSRKRILLEQHYFSISFIAFLQLTLHLSFLSRHLIQFMFHFQHGFDSK